MRGDVHELRAPLDAKGHEQRSVRYAVVVQSDLLPLSTWLVAPTSTSARPASFRPEIAVRGTTALVLVEQIAAVAPERLGQLVGHLSRDELVEVTSAIRTVLQLD